MEVKIIATQSITNSLDSTRELGLFLQKALTIIKMTHWYVCDYDKHVILGNLYESLDELFDDLQEEVIGTCRSNNVIFPKINLEALSCENLSAFNDQSGEIISNFSEVNLKLCNLFASLEFKAFLTQVPSGINNTVEEILSALNKASYLLSIVK